jgi:hypothetical protein
MIVLRGSRARTGPVSIPSPELTPLKAPRGVPIQVPRGVPIQVPRGVPIQVPRGVPIQVLGGAHSGPRGAHSPPNVARFSYGGGKVLEQALSWR